MRSNPLVREVLSGVTAGGKAQLDYLGLLLLQAVVLLVWWPKSSVTQVLESQHSPNTLAAVVMAVGVSMAYVALRAGAEEFLLPGQHGLRDWALATPLGLGRVVGGYLLGQIIHSLHLLALSTPLVLIAFTVSGGEWLVLGWCLAAALIQALFYRLCGALTHLMIGQHHSETLFVVRTLLLVVYIPIGVLAPVTSHPAFTYRALGAGVAVPPTFPGVSDRVVFLLIYAGLSILAVFVVYCLLARERRATATTSSGRTGVAEGVTS